MSLLTRSSPHEHILYFNHDNHVLVNILMLTQGPPHDPLTFPHHIVNDHALIDISFDVNDHVLVDILVSMSILS